MTSSTKSTTPSIGVMKPTGVQQQQQFVQQARSCSSANGIYVTQNQPATMLQQHSSYYSPANSQRLGAYEKPFTYTGIDFFGPMIVTFGRRSEKRWGVIFTCMTTRAIHLEVAHSLDTSSCIMCLRNFIGRRGYPRVIYSDNGTNFKATERILREELQRLNESELARSFDDIKWYFNPPAAPHMGVAWERLVRSVKTVLHQAYPNNKFNDETLRSALIEVEFIINSRPLTFVSLESEDDEALTPNHLLLGSSTGYKPIFTKDTNLREKWNQVQAIANRFWERWLKEYAPIITRRSK
ncbi:uncharacterized protein [Musca autumnalis]|uniref:uncharacterized protein n=1 Tax=Musca autumnalis TaxID=221902 RepID=UPI003CECA2A5